MTDYRRYLPSYRSNELQHICRAAQRGQSLCFVGVAGTGKSNLNKFLREERSYKQQYLAEQVDAVHFPIVDATPWNGTPQHLWEMMLIALEEATAHLTLEAREPKVIQLSAAGPALGKLQARLRQIRQVLDHRIMFVLDDFDNVLRRGPLDMLQQLYALRSDRNRGRLSYLVFTKRLPHVLGRQLNLAQESKFYDLFRQHIYALPLHGFHDARQMLRNINHEAGKPLGERELTQIQNLAGGHARLMRVIFDAWLQSAPRSEATAHFASVPDINYELARLFNGLHGAERETAIRVAHDLHTPAEQALLDHLKKRGLLTEEGQLHWFSPLAKRYLRGLPAPERSE